MSIYEGLTWESLFVAWIGDTVYSPQLVDGDFKVVDYKVSGIAIDQGSVFFECFNPINEKPKMFLFSRIFLTDAGALKYCGILNELPNKGSIPISDKLLEIREEKEPISDKVSNIKFPVGSKVFMIDQEVERLPEIINLNTVDLVRRNIIQDEVLSIKVKESGEVVYQTYSRQATDLFGTNEDARKFLANAPDE
jgi:hypothetical protein